MKLPKTLIRIGVVLLILLAAILLIRAVFSYAEGRKLARTFAELKKQGVPITAADLAAPCPDEDNAARLWKVAENLLTTGGKQDKELFSRAWMDFSAGKPVSPADKVALKDLIVRNEKAFEFLTAMGDKPCFLYRDPNSSLLEERFSPLALKWIHAAKLLILAAALSAEEGDVQIAVDRIRSGLRFAPLVAQEGSLIANLIAVADTRMLALYLGDILRGRKVGDDALLQLMGELDPGPWPGRLAGAIRGERTAFIEAGGYALRGGFKGIESLFGEPSIFRTVGAWLLRPVLKMDVRKALPIYQELETQARHPYFESRDFLRAQAQGLEKRPWYAFLSKALIANFGAAFMKEAMLEATIVASRTGLACRLYKSRTGQYPENLEALVPGILKEVPIDPFTGKPFVYRREGEGFIVYSLGSNEKDDGGRSTYMITQMVMEKDDDCTWREDR